MRVTHNMMYGEMQTNMNNILSEYMESNYQGATQKRVNRPSDDPAGTIKILNYRASIEVTAQYIDNSKDAASWLSSTDSALQQTSVILSRLSELAEQAATSTYTAEQRLSIGNEVKELYEQLINIANTEYAGDHLFAGHKTGSSAYDFGLGVMTQSPELDDVSFEAEGSVERTVMVRFPAGGEVGGPAALDYEFSKDGGETWETKTLPANATTLDLDGSIIEFAEGVPVTVQAYDPAKDINPANGTMLYVRPSAEYKGDDEDPPPEIDIYGDHNVVSAEANGSFPSNVQIRFDSDARVNTDGTLEYSYSTDNGISWKTTSTPTTAGSDSVRLIVGGGYVDLEVGGDGTLNAGQQMVVRPNRAAETGFEISKNEFLDVTTSGKDIFGGIYQGKDDDFPKAVEGVNIFETISDLIAWTETNNTTGIGESIEELKESSKHLLSQLAKVGGKSNRVSLNVTILQSNSDDQKSRMSSIEDIDVTQLSINIAKQQAAYQAVLKSSGMIMDLSLMNYI